MRELLFLDTDALTPESPCVKLVKPSTVRAEACEACSSRRVGPSSPTQLELGHCPVFCPLCV